MLNFKDKIWVTTNEQLQKYLHKCKGCWNVTLQGKLIIPYDEIQSFQFRTKKYTMVLNTKSKHSLDKELAHWICLHLDLITKQAFLFDSLNTIETTHPHVVLYLSKFCDSMNIKFHVFKLKTQQPNHLTCGFHALWMVHKTHKLNFSGILQLRTVFLPYSMYKREKFIIKTVLHDFSIDI